ncbi:uncharacterized protein DS421_6g184970 [Arachis hypogaea]|nr:uncharacterized protein DS421_6g184970 [Arachis hypogaea]
MLEFGFTEEGPKSKTRPQKEKTEIKQGHCSYPGSSCSTWDVLQAKRPTSSAPRYNSYSDSTQYLLNTLANLSIGVPCKYPPPSGDEGSAPLPSPTSRTHQLRPPYTCRTRRLRPTPKISSEIDLEFQGVSLEDNFMRLTRRCTIEKLHDNNESIQPQSGAYYCDFCQHYVTIVTPRYMIKIAIEDDNGHGIFVLFDREAAYLWKKSCADLFGEVQKDASLSCDVLAITGEKLLLKKSVGADKYVRTFRVRRVGDDAAIIAMFELPNYDADDERTLDGYLGKIPSSDHEYIVAKKDLCEVLDEGITSDGNCSNMKTNCSPLIDFLGEKGAEVLELVDISSEVDIMKEKGKTVNDSVLVDRECNLEIKVLLNSPPMETTDVLSAVFDGSPIHVIKKETVYNHPKGREVKRNLKKVFDNVVDEELGPTSKVLKNCDL